MATAMHLCLKADAGLTANIQRTHTLRPIGLMSGEGHQIDLHLLQIDFDLAGRLRRIDMEKNAARTGQLADGGDVVDSADLVVHVHDRHKNSVVAQRSFDHRRRDDAILARFEIRDLEAFALELASGIQYRLVLDLGGDDVLALGRIEMRDALDGQVVRLSCTGCPDDFTRIGVHQLSNLTARILHGFLGFPAKGMRARRRIAEVAFVGEALDHLGGNTRIHRRGRRVVQVNRQFHSDISYQAVALLNRWRTFLSCPYSAKCRQPCACLGAGRPAARPGA